MLMRTDPSECLDRLAPKGFGAPGTSTRPSAMATDASQDGHQFLPGFLLPGASADSIHLHVKRNVPAVEAEQALLAEDREYLIAEWPRSVGPALDPGKHPGLDNIQADYQARAVTLRIPAAVTAKTRRTKSSESARSHINSSRPYGVSDCSGRSSQTHRSGGSSAVCPT